MADFEKDKRENAPIVEPTTPSSGQGNVTTTPNAGEAPIITPATNGGANPDNYTFTAEQLDQMGPAVVDDSQQQVEPKYLTDWSTVDNVYEEAKKLNLPLVQVLQDYQRWGRETNSPTNWVGAVFQDADLSKSVTDNEELKKKQERKEKWDKVGNFLLHLGNVVGNVAGGGMGAVKLEDPIKFTERQRMLKERTDELRRSTNQSVWAQMAKESEALRRADLDKRRQDRLDKETQIRQEKNDAYRMYQQSVVSKNDAMAAYYDAKMNALERGLPLEEALKQARIAKEEAQTRLANVKANAPKGNSGGGGRKGTSGFEDTYERDRKGRTTRHVRKPLSGNAASNNSGGSTPKGSTTTPKGKKSTGVTWISNKSKK